MRRQSLIVAKASATAQFVKEATYAAATAVLRDLPWAQCMMTDSPLKRACGGEVNSNVNARRVAVYSTHGMVGVRGGTWGKAPGT